MRAAALPILLQYSVDIKDHHHLHQLVSITSAPSLPISGIMHGAKRGAGCGPSTLANLASVKDADPCSFGQSTSLRA